MERTHIAFFGRRNAGKSSLVNRFTSQELSIVSDVAGTTTDPVRKTMELLPLGPVIIIDTPGIDDEGTLGNQRIERSIRVIDETDIAILVIDGSIGIGDDEKQLIDAFEKRKIPYLVVVNKSDLDLVADPGTDPDKTMFVSALKGEGIEELKERVAVIIKQRKVRPLVSDLVEEGDIVVLVVPIDKSAPKDRLILPQQMVIRDLLGAGAIPVVVKDTELSIALEKVGDVKLVITDSQAFAKVSKIVPENITLTSFSIIMARFKGILDQSVEGADQLDKLNDGAKILISEGCTHHRQCEDIGTVKLPGWIREYTGKVFEFSFTSGLEFPKDISGYDLIIHCGACMLGETEVASRYRKAKEQGIPMTNYGIAIGKMKGILDRVIEFTKV
ncbi:[FeFe] hydrogenase H-cluster maturation GTPase HydF [Butyrivibrio sp. AE2032]|uniref:[FeFe] hydrogenase H-cluster maturation GTPase HydF n=1 Tax=Butyrivibrio sp. AE2032 TaxID=1458463 RepID=UPI00055389EE|nr:[FeFe] hydrogenase H-cluster maturation GTPase HydF [Butyrivibrio sp. AE2032]